MALIPVRQTYVDFVRDLSLAPPDEDERNKLDDIVVHLLTPIGASALHYTDAKVWSNFIMHAFASNAGDDSVTRESIIMALYELSRVFNTRLHYSLKTRHPDGRALARAAFAKSAKEGSPAWLHGLLQSLLLDKFIWANMSHAGEDTRLPQQPYLEKVDQLPAHAANIFKLYTEWDDTLSTFARNWAEYQNRAKMRSLGENSTEECNGSNDVLSSLYRGTSETITSMHINRVENNFCIAALGLLGLMLRHKYRQNDLSATQSPGVSETVVRGNTEEPSEYGGMSMALVVMNRTADGAQSGCSESYDDSIRGVSPVPSVHQGTSRKRNAVEPSIAQLLKRENDQLPNIIADLDDFELLRPLYTLAAISPICLLSPFHISSGSHSRVSLTALGQTVYQPFLRPDRIRRDIEHRLLNIVLDMAVKGRGEFYRHMDNAMCSWRDEGIINNANECVVDATTKVGQLDWNQAYADQLKTQPIKLRVVQHLSKEVTSVAKRRQAPSEIILSSPSPEWFDAVVQSRVANNTHKSTGRGELQSSGSNLDLGGSAGTPSLPVAKEREKRAIKPVKRGSLGKSLAKPVRKHLRRGAEHRNTPRSSGEDELETITDEDEPVLKNSGGSKVVRGGGTNRKRARSPESDLAPVSKRQTKNNLNFDIGSNDTVRSTHAETDNEVNTTQICDARVQQLGGHENLLHRAARPVFQLPFALDPREPVHKASWSMTVFVPSLDEPSHEVLLSLVPHDHYSDVQFLSKVQPFLVQKWNSELLSVPIAPAMSFPKSFRDMTFDDIHPEIFSGHRAVKSIRRSVWTQLSPNYRRALYVWANVHVIDDGMEESLQPGSMFGWNAFELNQLVDLTMMRECQDQTIGPTEADYEDNGAGDSKKLKRDWNMRKISLLGFMASTKNMREMEEAHEKQLKALTPEANNPPNLQPPPFFCFSLLDIPLHMDIADIEFDDTSRYIMREEADHTYHTRISMVNLVRRRMLAANAGAWSDWHMDTSGLSTLLHVSTGEKLVLLPKNRHIRPGSPHWERSVQCDAVLVRSNEDLYIRPGQVYAMLTIKDSICYKGHFYFDEHYTDSLFGITYEHYIGTDTTNIELSRSPLLLFKRVLALRSAYDMGLIAFHAIYSPTWSSVAALFVLIRHIDQLTPRMPEHVVAEHVWQGSPDFEIDYKYVTEALIDFVEMLQARECSDPSEQTALDVLWEMEESFAELCEQFEAQIPEDERGSSIEVLCLCGSHSRAVRLPKDAEQTGHEKDIPEKYNIIYHY